MPEEIIKNNEKKFIISFFVYFAIISIFVVAVGIIVDPRELFLTGIFQPLTPPSLLEMKLSLLNKLDYNPEIYILGSSTSFYLSTDMINDMTGKKSFNLSVENGRPEDFLAISKSLVLDMKKQPRLFIIGLNLFLLDDINPLPSYRQLNKFYVKYLGLNKFDYYKRYLLTMEDSFSEPYFKDVMKVIYYNVTSYPENKFWYITETGVNKREYQLLNNEIFDSYGGTKMIVDNENDITKEKERKKLLRERVGELKELITFLDKYNIKVAMFLTPTYPDALKILESNKNYKKMYNDVLSLSDELSNDHANFNFYDFSDIRSFNGTENSFIDIVHIGKENCDKIIKTIFLNNKYDL